jgi:purine-binding chemotaxis protein CheW
MSTKYTVFQLNGEEYGLDISNVKTIEKDMTIKKMANAPSNVKGKISLRGNEVPVYNLRRKFGFEDKKPDKFTRFLLSSSEGIDIAIEVDRVKGILDLEVSDLFDVPQIIKCSSTSYIKAIAKADEGIIYILNSDFLLDNEERESLKSSSKK